jgi:murein biosynthesis integral membrane protein MurJ
MSAPGRQARAARQAGVGNLAVPAYPAGERALPGARSPAGEPASGGGSAIAQLSRPASAAGDSLTVATWTMLSRVTGLARVAVAAAVLGPTYAGNTYQFTNSLPNLLYYGFLAGGFFSSLLAPSLVRHIDAGDRRASERVAGGLLGVAMAAMLAVAPLAIILGPLALKIGVIGGPRAVGAEEVRVARLLIVTVIPQVFLYGVVGTATAVMNARRRFALAAGAPALENLGTIAVLGMTAALYGMGRNIGDLPTGEILLLGLGSTGAVALHAATQWWGARRAGVVLLPRFGWRDPEVRSVVRRALPALGQAGLEALQLLALLIAANRLPGGVVAFGIAWNFYNLANNLGTAPVALSLVPRLARMSLSGDDREFRDTLVRGLALGFFITIPAAAGFLVLARPLASAISFGSMDSAAGVSTVTAALRALSVAVVAQTVFMIATYASYSRKDTRSPLRSMIVQAAVCTLVVGLSVLAHGTAVLTILGLAVSVSVVAAAGHLAIGMRRTLGSRGTERLVPSLVKFVAGAVIMAGPAWITATAVSGWLGRPLGARVGMVAAALAGAATFVAVQAAWRAPEVGWLAEGLHQLGGRAAARPEPEPGGPDRPAGSRLWPRPLPRPLPGHYRRERLPRCPSGRWLIGPALAATGFAGAATTFGPRTALAALTLAMVMAGVWRWPALGAYLAIGLTPLTVNLDLGHALPLIRPNEALDLLVGATLAVRGLVRARTGQLPRIRLNRVELAMLLMAVSNSVIPLLWMVLRQEAISQSDLLYALVMWKLLGIYVIVRVAVRTEDQIRRCLWLSVAAACIVALVAVMQSLSLFGVPRLLAEFFGGPTQFGPPGGRGSSTLGLPAATADLMVFNLAIVCGLWARYRRHPVVLAAAAALMVFGALAAGEFAGVIGLIVGLICIAIVTGSARLLGWSLPVLAFGGYVMWPVISGRLIGFQSASGLPASWVGRLQNLQTYFWPKLFSDWNFVLGVRPSAVVDVVSASGNEVWIESGYTWLLWGGGIPLLLSFLFFVYVTAQQGWRAAHGTRQGRSVAGMAIFVAVVVIAVLMIFDPHLTYRGSADEFFFLIALALSRDRRPEQAGHQYHARAELNARRSHDTRQDDQRHGPRAGHPRQEVPAAATAAVAGAAAVEDGTEAGVQAAGSEAAVATAPGWRP